MTEAELYQYRQKVQRWQQAIQDNFLTPLLRKFEPRQCPMCGEYVTGQCGAYGCPGPR